MTAKPITKDIIILVVVSVLAVTALIFGVSNMPSPTEKRNIEYDAQRSEHLSTISRAIEDYHRTNYVLPAKLEDLQNSSSIYTIYEEDLNDPETKKMYEYSKTGKQEYNLCATFTTDSAESKKKYKNEYYEAFGFSHPIGYKCFELKVKDNSSGRPSLDITKLLPTQTSSNATAKLASLTKQGECRWIVTFLLKDFSPNSEISIDSKGTLAENCDPAMTHPYSWHKDYTHQTDEYGTTSISYTQNDYGTYNYAFIDEDGNTASVKVQYDLSPTPAPSKQPQGG